MRKSVTSQTEKAFVAYIEGNQVDTVLAPCQVYAAGLVDVPTTLVPPWITFAASAPEQLGFDSGIYELKLTVSLATQVDDEQDEPGQDIHRERLEALRDLLEDIATVQASVNPPVSGPDSREVQNFTLSSIVYQDDSTTFAERKIMTAIEYYICSSPSDSPG